MPGLSGTEIKTALKKGLLWNVPSLAGAGDGILVLPASLKRDAVIHIDDSQGLYFSKEGHPGPIKAEIDEPAYLRYDGLDLLLSLFMGIAGAPVQQGTSAAYAYIYKFASNLDGLFGMFAKNMKTYIEELPSVKIAALTLKGEVGAELQISAGMIASNKKINPTLSNPVVATVAVGLYPYGVAWCGSNDRVYVVNNGAASVSVINPATNTVVATVAVGVSPYGVAWCGSNDSVYVTNAGTASVSVINPATNTVVATVAVGLNPYGVAWCGSNDRVYVANYGVSSVSVINPATNTVVATVAVGLNPYGVAWCGSNDRVYVANLGASSVSVIVPESNTTQTFANVTLPNELNRVLFAQGVFRINNQSGAQLGSGDIVYPSSFEFTPRRMIKGEYTGQYKTYSPNPQDLIDEPCNEGMAEITLKLTFPRHTSSANIAALIADTRKKMDMTFTGPLIEGNYYYQFKVQFPHLQLKDVPVADAQGNIKEPLEFVVHGCDTAPAGMTGLTDPFWISGINRRTTDPLA